MKRILTITLLFFMFGALSARHYDKKRNLSANSLASESVNAFRFSELYNNGAFISESDRGFILENPFGVVVLDKKDNTNTDPVKVSLNVHYAYELNNQLVQKTEAIILELGTSGSAIKDIDYIKIVGALTMSVSDVTLIEGDLSNVDFFMSCRGNLIDLFPQNVQVTGVTKNLQNVDSKGNLEVSWNLELTDLGKTYFPEEYELEWTYLSEGIEEAFVRDYLFKNNSSRVVVTADNYSIPLVYEKGVIVYRVRAVGHALVNNKITEVRTKWSLDDNTTSLATLDPNHYYEFDGLEVNMNWQSTITFAEEGKNKAVVSYHDGTLRNRQALTRINTDERVVVGETYYDFNGRPIIQVLPVPVSGVGENNFDYRTKFNVNEEGNEITKNDYEPDTCVATVPKLDVSSGASRYYSSSNGFGTDGNVGNNILNKELIPDAEQYPFTQIRYRNDNTDRVIEQSGVGAAHILGSGHETKYMYGAPQQSELTRLFGTQVGRNGHYKKNAIIDPNGQISVSYLNPEGKVVATALTGASPEELKELAGNKDKSVDDELLEEGVNNLIVGTEKEFSYPFNITSNVDYTFKYELDAKPFNLICENIDPSKVATVDLTIIGAYDVQLLLKNQDCGEVLFDTTLSTDGGYNLTSESTSFEKSLSAAELEIGTYVLSKRLVLNQEKLLAYQEQYLTDTTFNCVAREDYFIDQAMGGSDLSVCDLDCDNCDVKVDEFISGAEANGVEISANEEFRLKEYCALLCLKNLECYMGLELMLADLDRDGQYAEITKDHKTQSISDLNNSDEFPAEEDVSQFNDGIDNVVSNSNADPDELDPTAYQLSIFNPGTYLRIYDVVDRSPNDPLSKPSWKRPLRVDPIGATGLEFNFRNQLLKGTVQIEDVNITTTSYYDERGELVYAVIEKLEDGTYLPEIDENAEDKLIPIESRQFRGEEAVFYNLEIKHLEKLEDFIKYWERDFAYYFLPYHPEFYYYENCISLTELNLYGEGLLQLTVPLASNSEVFFEPNTLDDLVTNAVVANDPIFSDVRFDRYEDLLKSKLDNYILKSTLGISGTGYLSMAQYVNYNTHCLAGGVSCGTTDCSENISEKFAKDDETAIYTFKAMYLAERNRIVRTFSHKKAINNMNYNGCISNQGFGGSSEHHFLLKNSEFVAEYYRSQVGEFVNNTVNSVVSIASGGISGLFGKKVETPPLKVRYVQTINPLQLCNDADAVSYEDKNKIFFQNIDGYGDVGTVNDICYVQGEENSDWIEGTCYPALAPKVAEIINADKLKDFDACGLCPVSSDFKVFASSIFDGSGVQEPIVGLNCPDVEHTIRLGNELKNYLSSNGGLLDWSYSTNGDKITGVISEGGTNLLEFEIDLSSLPIPAGVDLQLVFDAMKIADLKPRELTTGTDSIRIYFELNKFLFNHDDLVAALNAIDLLEAAQVRFFTVPIIIKKEGVVVTDLNTCDLNPACTVSNYSDKVLGVLNALTYSYEFNFEEVGGDITTVGKTYDIIEDIDLEEIDFTEYDYPVRQLLMVGESVITLNERDIAWNSEDDQSLFLRGDLTYDLGDGLNAITFTIEDLEPNVNLDFTTENITRFANARPFSSELEFSNAFSADAYVQKKDAQNVDIDDEYDIYKVKITLSSTDAMIPYGSLTKCLQPTTVSK